MKQFLQVILVIVLVRMIRPDSPMAATGDAILFIVGGLAAIYTLLWYGVEPLCDFIAKFVATKEEQEHK